MGQKFTVSIVLVKENVKINTYLYLRSGKWLAKEKAFARYIVEDKYLK